MASLNSLIILILLPSLEVLSQAASPNEQTLHIQALLPQVCKGVEDRSSCLLNVQAELDNAGPPSSNAVLSAALQATLNEARAAIESLSKFTALSVSYREQVAIEDCKELLDFSISEIAWSIGEMKKIKAGSTNSHYGGNLKAWLSAALSNQDTCLEGFEGTDGRLENFIRGSLKQVTQLVGNVLTMYSELHSLPFPSPRTNSSGETSEFPAWMTEGDQELLKASPVGMHFDAVVASDGSGHYRTIAEAIIEAPSYSIRRYVIYVKKGVYSENIDLKKKKTNIMFVGDGIGATIVTGNRHFMQGWTTFRTATVGELPKYRCNIYWNRIIRFEP